MSDQGVWVHAEQLPSVTPAARMSLGEGDTPLADARALAAYAGVRQLLLKREDTNPTGSHKDRAAAVQISRCRAAQVRLTCATTPMASRVTNAVSSTS